MASNSVLVSVTQEDIDKGCPKKSENCPIVRAVGRLSLGDLGISTSIGGHSYISKWSVPDISLSRAAHRFISRFDAGKEVKPFRFVLTASKYS